MEPKPSAHVRSGMNHTFVCRYKNPEYYLPRCFPSLYPYGRGCPSDKNCQNMSMSKYIKHMLCLGGGPQPRRFQQNSKFIFTLYTMEMKRKLGGVAYVAQKSSLDDEPEVAPTIKEINELLAYLDVNDQQRNDISEHIGVSETSTDQCSNEKQMQKLIQRLVPYSNSLQGTISHIAYERAKLMAMIPSPIIRHTGSWRLFFTVAPADLYDSRFYEVVGSPIIDSSMTSWIARLDMVRMSVRYIRSLYICILYLCS